MTLILYELAGEDAALRFSPYCWRARMALAHKKLQADCRPFRFTEKEKIAPSGGKTVPVLVDGESWIRDSWAIACHLEDQYSDRPSLFGGGVGRAEACFISHWVGQSVHPKLIWLIMPDLWKIIAERDREYFRATREKRFGMPIEEVGADRDQQLDAFRLCLAPARSTLTEYPFLCGEAPAYADYALFGAFQWARSVSPYLLLEADDPVFGWRKRMLGLFDGLAEKAPGHDC